MAPPRETAPHSALGRYQERPGTRAALLSGRGDGGVGLALALVAFLDEGFLIFVDLLLHVLACLLDVGIELG